MLISFYKKMTIKSIICGKDLTLAAEKKFSQLYKLCDVTQRIEQPFTVSDKKGADVFPHLGVLPRLRTTEISFTVLSMDTHCLPFFLTNGIIY